MTQEGGGGRAESVRYVSLEFEGGPGGDLGGPGGPDCVLIWLSSAHSQVFKSRVRMERRTGLRAEPWGILNNEKRAKERKKRRDNSNEKPSEEDVSVGGGGAGL